MTKLEEKFEPANPTTLLAKYDGAFKRLEKQFDAKTPSPVRCALIEIAANLDDIDTFMGMYRPIRAKYQEKISPEGHASIIRAAHSLYLQLKKES